MLTVISNQNCLIQDMRPDMFVALGQEYTDIRDLVARVLVGEDAHQLVELLQVLLAHAAQLLLTSISYLNLNTV